MSDNKGLSILIPIFNYDIRNLVRALQNQGQQINTDFEILCYDDFSNDRFKKLNREIAELAKVKYKELPSNIGRAGIRNLLAKEASYDYLLFLDCDSEIPNDSYLKNYSNYFGKEVIVGGRLYAALPPKEPEFYLHWKKGKKKEEQNAQERSRLPYSSFMIFNVLIKKEIYRDSQLDETISGYGHEDTKLGYLLEQKKIPVTHIDNPVIHVGLDTNKIFLNKTREAIKNLKNLTDNGYGKDTKLYKTAHRLRKLGLVKLFIFFCSVLQFSIERNLKSANPSMVMLDIFKLSLFLKK